MCTFFRNWDIDDWFLIWLRNKYLFTEWKIADCRCRFCLWATNAICRINDKCAVKMDWRWRSIGRVHLPSARPRARRMWTRCSPRSCEKWITYRRLAPSRVLAAASSYERRHQFFVSFDVYGQYICQILALFDWVIIIGKYHTLINYTKFVFITYGVYYFPYGIFGKVNECIARHRHNAEANETTYWILLANYSRSLVLCPRPT